MKIFALYFIFFIFTMFEKCLTSSLHAEFILDVLLFLCWICILSLLLISSCGGAVNDWFEQNVSLFVRVITVVQEIIKIAIEWGKW